MRRYEVVEGFLLLEDGGDGLEEVLDLELLEVLEGDAGLEDDVDPAGELVGALHADEADVLLLALYLPAGADAVVQQRLQPRLGRQLLVHQLEVHPHQRLCVNKCLLLASGSSLRAFTFSSSPS